MINNATEVGKKRDPMNEVGNQLATSVPVKYSQTKGPRLSGSRCSRMVRNSPKIWVEVSATGNRLTLS